MKEEKGKSQNNRKKNLAKLIGLLFISIVIHIILVIIFFHYGFHKRAMSWLNTLNTELTPTEQKERAEQAKAKRDAVLAGLQALKRERRDSQPAQLRAPVSNFGWVLFDEPVKKSEPNMPTIIPTTQHGAVGVATQAYATEDELEIETPKKPLPTELLQATPQEIQPSSPAPEEKHDPIPLAPKKLDAPTKIETSTKTSLVDKATGTVIETKTTDHASQTALPAAQQPVDVPQEKKSNPQDETPTITKPPVDQRARVLVRGAQSIEQKPKRNILALTKGFVEKRHHRPAGTDLIDRDGDPDKRPDDNELELIEYEANLNWCLQASWKQNFSFLPPEQRPFKEESQAIERNPAIEFTLNKNGHVTNCTLLQSSGNTRIDRMVMLSVKFASPFPAIPDHFGFATYTTTRTIFVCHN